MAADIRVTILTFASAAFASQNVREASRMPEGLFNVAETAEFLRVSQVFLHKLRLSGKGPRFVKMGARVCYDRGDLAEWIDRQKQVSTARPSGDNSQ
jgi:predicted DNA-binding transcriptional regulator AlpA